MVLLRSRRQSITVFWIRGAVRAEAARGSGATDRTAGAAKTQRVDSASTPLRIAGIDPERAFSGGETQVMGLTLALQRAGHRAELVCDPDGALWERAREAGVVCRPLSVRNSIDIAAGLRVRALSERKGHHVLIEAMALALGEADKALEAGQLRALIAGAGPLEPALAAEIRRRGLESRVRMLGHVGDIRTLLWALDIFVMP